MELDHLFFLTTAAAPEIAALEALGLTPTYRRTHVGQGTANVCYAFENAYLEVLWVTDLAETRSAPIARMKLDARAAWRTEGTSPFGLAWRPTTPDAPAVPTWSYRPPYLPDGVGIDVAVASDDPRQPSLFTFPGSQAPRTWPEARRGALQAAGGFDQLTLQTIWLPPDVPPSAALAHVAAAFGARVAVDPDGAYAMDVALRRADGGPPHTIRLPTCQRLS